MSLHRGTIEVEYDGFVVEIEDIEVDITVNRNDILVYFQTFLQEALEKTMSKYTQWEDTTLKNRKFKLPETEEEINPTYCRLTEIWNDNLSGWEDYDLNLKKKDGKWRFY